MNKKVTIYQAVFMVNVSDSERVNNVSPMFKFKLDLINWLKDKDVEDYTIQKFEAINVKEVKLI